MFVKNLHLDVMLKMFVLCHKGCDVDWKVYFFSLQNAKRLAFQELKKEATANSSSFDWASYEDKDLIRKNKFYFSLGSKLTTEQLQQVINTLINALDILPF